MAFKVSFRGSARLRRLMKQLPEDIRAEIASAIEKTAKKIAEEARFAVPKKTHVLVEAIRHSVQKSGLSGKVGIYGKRGKRSAFYAHFVEFGTRPHVIKVKNTRALRRGTIVFGKDVMHPGSPAQPFLTPAFERNRAEGVLRIRAAVKSALNKGVAGAGGPD